jgi:hypothetical protein
MAISRLIYRWYVGWNIDQGNIWVSKAGDSAGVFGSRIAREGSAWRASDMGVAVGARSEVSAMSYKRFLWPDAAGFQIGGDCIRKRLSGIGGAKIADP